MVVGAQKKSLYTNKEPSQYKKRYVCQRTTQMTTMLNDVTLFQISDTPTQLCSILTSNKRSLDSKTIEDLLTIASIGTEEHVLPPSTTGPRKRRKRTRKLATHLLARQQLPGRVKKGRKNTPISLRMQWIYYRLTEYCSECVEKFTLLTTSQVSVDICYCQWKWGCL